MTVTAEAQPSLSDMPYEIFLAERQKIVEARQRAQQRFDQIVTAGAAGALVLSITFLDSIAASTPAAVWQLKAAWLFLLSSLGLNFLSHFLSQFAFDSYLRSFDGAYRAGEECDHSSVASRTSRRLDGVSATAFVIGVILLATFAISNLEQGTSSANGQPDIEVEGPATEAP